MKTGGTTFQRRVLKNFELERVFPTMESGFDPHHYKSNLPEFRGLSDEILRRHQFITVHLPYWAFEERSEFTTGITVLRDPVERAISHMVQTAPLLGMTSVEEVWRDDLQRTALTDFQLKQFAQTPKDMPPADYFKAMYNRDTASKMAKRVQGPVDEDGLERACERLQILDAVGFTDDLDAFVGATCQRYAWNDQPMEPQNVLGQPEINAGVRDEIVEALEMDIRFYEHARTRRDPRMGGNFFVGN